MTIVAHRRCALCPETENEHFPATDGADGFCNGCGLGHVFVPRPDAPWTGEAGYLRRRVESWMLSSGGTAMYDDDRNPRHLLFLLATVLMENGWTIPPDTDRTTEPCPVRSSVTDQRCLLPAGHPQHGPARFHKYERRPEPHVWGREGRRT